MKKKHLFLLGILTSSLVACNDVDQAVNTVEETDPDTYHENVFSWDNPKSNSLGFAARSAGSKITEVSNAEADSISRITEKKLESRTYSKSLWKPVDYACDELALALWNEYGTIVVDGKTVLDESILKSSCKNISEEQPEVDLVAGRVAAGSNPPSEAVDRKYPYKMIGNSWKNFNIGVYKSTGGETQFKKERKRFWVTGWYDTDATRIGVRIYLFDCQSSGQGRACVLNRSTSDWYANDDYVSKRDFAVGASVSGTLNGLYPHISWTTVGDYLNRVAPFPLDPATVQNQINKANSVTTQAVNYLPGKGGRLGDWVIDLVYGLGSVGSGLNSYYSSFYSALGLNTAVPNIGTVNLRVADGVMSMHSVDHAGMKFRAISSAGLGDWNSFNQYKTLDYVTW